MTLLDEFNIRKGKLSKLHERGVNPYPSRTEQRTIIADVLAAFQELSSNEKTVRVSGRILVTRIHGKMVFADLRDESGTIQIQCTVDQVGEESFALFTDFIDPGDFIEVCGIPFFTKREQQTISVREWRILTKALRPLPEKWHGLKDIEIRYRERELDLIANEDVRKAFHIRSSVLRVLRDELDRAGFQEVETPILQPIAGGATARPFVTHHNALDHHFYLRIAPELYLKRCIVGGFEKVYELGRQFRNEGIDRSHNPEFTSLEFYWAYADYVELMAFTETLLKSVVERVTGSLQITYDGNEIDFSKSPWPRMTFRDAVREGSGIDIFDCSREDLIERMKSLKIDCDYQSADMGRLYDELYKEVVRKRQVQPVFVIDYPIEMEPLAKKCETDPRLVQRFQLIVGGLEVLKAYSELNDPIDQRNRFEAQQALRDSGDDEAQSIDEQFLKALEHGMPPTAGWGMGIDRFTMMLANQSSVKDVILFPTLKTESSSSS